jgi:hypothetical protein
MPSINPENYNIDSFNSLNLGPITVEDFRDYVLNHNLPGLDPVLSQNGIDNYGLNIYAPLLFNPTETVNDLPNLTEVSFIPSPINDNTSPRPDNKKRNLFTNEKPFYGSQTEEQSFEVIPKSLEDPGSIDSWVEEAGFSTDVFSVRNFNNLTNNEYGPEFVETYNDPDQPLESTGYKQYPSDAGGDVIGPVIARSLGFSPENFINFPSPLQETAKERRIEELANRVKLNFVDDTVGRLNLDPLGLLAGQSIFLPDYTITKRKGILGKAAQFTASLGGFNWPRSPLKGGKNPDLGSNAFQADLLDFTGRAQRKVLYKNVYSSKYTPELLTKGYDLENAGADTLSAGGAQSLGEGKKKPNNYLKLNPKLNKDESTRERRIGNWLRDLTTKGDQTLQPKTDRLTTPSDPFVTMGIDGQYPSIDNLDPNSVFTNLELEQPSYDIPGADVEYFPNKTTLKPSLEDSDDSLSNFTHITPSTFYWQNRKQEVAKRGLLDFTQKMINNTDSNGYRGGAKFIGRFDSNSNLKDIPTDVGGKQQNVPRMTEVSKGNLVRGAENDHYCRSWTTRNPYQNHYDLIRRDRLYRAGGKVKPGDTASGPFFGPYQSTLEDTGHVKIAPHPSDDNNIGIRNGKIVNDGNDVKRYMFSIENLAWTEAPEKIGLEPCEIGPNGGRIMWFPPYDINFTDNTTANWDSTVFIGRAEPIYTYNHTERKGTLSWTIITDHPSVLNDLKKQAEERIWKFFAGCGVDVMEFFSREQIETIIEEEQRKPETGCDCGDGTRSEKCCEPPPPPVPDPVPDPVPKEPPFKEAAFYFRNATSDYGIKGRKGSKVPGRSIEVELDVEYDTGVQNQISKTKTGDYLMLNEKNWLKAPDGSGEGIDALIDFLATEDGQRYCVEFQGYCSALSNNNYNQILSIDRANRVANYVKQRVKAKGETGGSGYTYIPENFKTGEYGYKCKDGGPNGRSGTIQDALPESAYYKKNLPNIDLTKCSEAIYAYSNKKQRAGYWWVAIDEKNKPSTDSELSKEGGRWIVTANGEAWNGWDANTVDEDGQGIENEQAEGAQVATSSSSSIFSRTAKEDRVVTLRVFENTEYINQQEEKRKKEIPKEQPFSIEPLPIITPTQITRPPAPPLVITDESFVGPLTEEQFNNLQSNNAEITNGIISGSNLLEQANREADKTENNDITNTNAGDGSELVNDDEIKIQEKLVKRVVQRLFRECDYFEKIQVSDPFLYETIKEKVKFFHPAFHSMTPEGLNSRLTFLHQCMRQGPSLRETDNRTQNMAFGKPPILVLRIGDFYYTKIVPDSMNVNYEPLQWDMNPEGVGVQPMIAKVDLNFSIIGGSSLDGPIRQLQNAVSFNFFANTSVYNPRRYYDLQTGEVTSLEVLKEEQNQSSIQVGGNVVGFGAFKSRESADTEVLGGKPYTSPSKNLVKKFNRDQLKDVIVNNDIKDPTLKILEDNTNTNNVGTIILTDSSGNTITNAQANNLDTETVLGDQSNLVNLTPGDPNSGLISQSDVNSAFVGVTTSFDDIKDSDLYDTYDIKLETEIPDLLGQGTGSINVGNLGFFTKPDGSGGIKIKEFGFYLTPEAEDLGYTIQIDVNLKLTYPPNSGIPTENITDRAYIDIAKVTTKEGSVYKDYKTLYSDEYNQNSIFDVQRFFTDWFTKNSRFNGVHKLDVSWTFTREVIESTIEPGTQQKVGQLVSKTYTETFEYDLYSDEYAATVEEINNVLSSLPPGTFFP